MSIFGINHTRKDALLTSVVTMTSTAGTSDVLDLTQVGGIDEARLAFSSALASTKVATITLEGSSDQKTWVAVPNVSVKLTGVADGSLQSASILIPPDCPQFIRGKVTGEAGQVIEIAICV